MQSLIETFDDLQGRSVRVVRASEVETANAAGYELLAVVGTDFNPMFGPTTSFLMALTEEATELARQEEVRSLQSALADAQVKQGQWREAAKNVFGQLRDLASRCRAIDRTPKGVKDFADTCLGAAAAIKVGDESVGPKLR